MPNILDEICKRLSAEVSRVGHTEVAKLAGIARATLYNWIDTGSISLDKLAKLEKAGIDVNFILTGQRNHELTPRKVALLDNYDHLTEVDKASLERHALVLAQQTTLKKSKTA